ncbi:MAG: HNH endonuclease [Fusobacteriaceae bacterium]
MEYKIIKDYSRYEINKVGHIRNCITKKELRTRINKNGYVDSSLISDTGKRMPKEIHRLVALTFVQNYNENPIVNHIDSNKINNHYSNLEWCTISYNLTHAIDSGSCSYVKLSKDMVEFIYLNPNNMSIADLAKCFNVSISSINGILYKKKWTRITGSLGEANIIVKFKCKRVHVKLTNIETNEELYFKSIAEACRKFKMNASVFTKIVSGERSNKKPYKNFLITVCNDYPSDENLNYRQ